MTIRRQIDDRDVNRLLSALSDVQIANLFGMSLHEVYELRQSRKLQILAVTRVTAIGTGRARPDCM